MVKRLLLTTLAMLITATATAQAQLPTDSIKTKKGDVRITFLGYGSLSFEYKGKVVYVDPVSKWADYTVLPKADLILVTQNMTTHLDTRAIYTLRTPHTELVLCESCANADRDATIMRNGDVSTFEGIKVEAVPAYNKDEVRTDGVSNIGRFHKKGDGNGYVLTFDDKRFYVASDTDFIPEMKLLKNIDVAFLPLDFPETMPLQEVAKAAKVIKPKVLYPYEYWRADPQGLVDLLKGTKGIEVRIRGVAGIIGTSASPGWDYQGITRPLPNY